MIGARERDLWVPLLLKHYGAVVETFETPKTRSARKFSRKAAIDGFLLTRNATLTAKGLRVSTTAVDTVLRKAFRVARMLEGVSPFADDRVM